MRKRPFDADAAEEYFTNLCVNYQDMKNKTFDKDNRDRDFSYPMYYSSEYSKFLGMELAMREVCKYFGKFEIHTKSPFKNDPFFMIAEAYERLYNQPYVAQLAPYDGEEEEKPFGQTFFPDDGSKPVVTVYIHTPLEHAPEIFAHELAHVAVGPGKGHGEEWERAFEAIQQEYINIGTELFGEEAMDNENC